jgi:LysM repeat protein
MLKAATIRLALAAALVMPASGLLQVPNAQAQARCGDSWRVSPGDTLSSISRACGIPAAAIEAANPSIDWRRLQVGARVNLDTRGRPPAGTSGRPQAYVVQRGDTLSSIARSFGVSLQALLAANPGLGERDLVAGRTIYFSGFAGRPNTPPPPPVRPAPTRVEVRLDERDNYPGGGINLLVEGLRPGDAVSAEAGPTSGRGGTEAETRVDRRGFANLALDISPRARPGERWSYEIYDGRGRVVADGIFRVGEEPRRPGRPERVSITGVISNEGVECPVIRAENGRLYSLAGGLSGFRPGDRVTVLGEVAQMSTCMQGTTIAVDSIRPAR